MTPSNLLRYGIIMILVAAGGYYFLVFKKGKDVQTLQKSPVISSYSELLKIKKKRTIIVEGTISSQNKTAVRDYVLACRERLKRGRARTMDRENDRKATWTTIGTYVSSFYLDMADNKRVFIQKTGTMNKVCPSGKYHTEYTDRYRRSRYRGMKTGEQISVLAEIVPGGAVPKIMGRDYYGGSGEAMVSSAARNKMLLTFGAIGLALLGLGSIIFSVVKKIKTA